MRTNTTFVHGILNPERKNECCITNYFDGSDSDFFTVPVPTFDKVTVPVPVPAPVSAPYLDHKSTVKKKIGKNLAFLQMKLIFKKKIDISFIKLVVKCELKKI